MTNAYPDVNLIPRILLAAGGTGGHVYPAIAIADAIVRRWPWALVEFAGTQLRMEWQAVPKAGYAIHPIRAVGFQRGRVSNNLTFPIVLAQGMLDSLSLVRAYDPDVVIGAGGFVSGPVLFAAQLLGRPTVIQEQNAHAGVTNRLLSRRAETVFIAFEGARSFFKNRDIRLVGNPIRTAIQRPPSKMEARARLGIPENAVVTLVLGGSGGSLVVNQTVAAFAEEVLRADQDRYIIWQTGPRYADQFTTLDDIGGRLRVLSYLDDMPAYYAAADVAVARSGALTCTELLATATPAILIPSPNVAADHQTTNARALEQVGAAIVVPEPYVSDKLSPALLSLLNDPDRRKALSAAAAAVEQVDAADHIAERALDLALLRARGRAINV